jgi:hypothetical protein
MENLVCLMIYGTTQIILIFIDNKKNVQQYWSSLFTVIPEDPQKGRNFSLSLDELQFLSQLIKSCLKLENKVQELFEEMFLSFKTPRNSSGNISFCLNL